MKILVSFSGGRSSAYMSWLIKKNWEEENELRFVFANTGKEREETLRFVKKCDEEWNLRVTWLEAVVNEGEVACAHRVVDFENACRDGAVFESVIRKYGIPNMNYLHCTRELKANTILSFMRSVGWIDCVTAQGIRADEPRRLGNKPTVIYPLAHVWPTTKMEVREWWKEQSFDLGLLDYQGNCDCCHKKSLTKLVRIAKESPERFGWWGEMESRYGLAGSNDDGTPRTFYRGHRSSLDILKMAPILSLPRLPFEDEDAGCGESCEAF